MDISNRLRILFIPAWYPSEKNPINGVFIKEHAKSVQLFNDVVVLYSEGSDKTLNKFWKIVSDKKEDGIRTIRIRYRKSPIPKTTYLIYLKSIEKAFKKLLNEGWKPDIIHAHVYSAGVPAVILGKKYDIPVAITEHFTNFATHSLRILDVLKAKYVMKRVRIILPVSYDLKCAISDYYKIRGNFEIIPNVVNTNIFYPANCNHSENLNKKRLLTVCNLTTRKGIDYLLHSLYQLRKRRDDFYLDIIGDGPEKTNYERISYNLGINDIVFFHGRKPEVARFMRCSNIFVLPSLYENFGVVYIEAMACGKPVIATNAGGPKEIVKDFTGILVPPKDVNALTEAIDYMLDNYKSYSLEKIAKYARDNFGYESVGKRLDIIYKRIIKYHENKNK